MFSHVRSQVSSTIIYRIPPGVFPSSFPCSAKVCRDPWRAGTGDRISVDHAPRGRCKLAAVGGLYARYFFVFFLPTSKNNWLMIILNYTAQYIRDYRWISLVKCEEIDIAHMFSPFPRQSCWNRKGHNIHWRKKTICNQQEAWTLPCGNSLWAVMRFGAFGIGRFYRLVAYIKKFGGLL